MGGGGGGAKPRKYGMPSVNFKGQLQRFHKLSLFDRFRHAENGFDINF